MINMRAMPHLLKLERTEKISMAAGAESRKREHASFCLFLILLPTSLLFFFPSSFLSRFLCLSSLPLPCLCPCLSSCLFLSVFSPCLCLSYPASLPLPLLSFLSPLQRQSNHCIKTRKNVNQTHLIPINPFKQRKALIAILYQRS